MIYESHITRLLTGNNKHIFDKHCTDMFMNINISVYKNNIRYAEISNCAVQAKSCLLILVHMIKVASNIEQYKNQPSQLVF